MRLRLFTILLFATVIASPSQAGTLYAVDPDTDGIVKLDSVTGAVLGSMPTPESSSGGPDGLAASGSALFFVNGMASNVVYEMDLAGTVMGSHVAPMIAGGTDGLAFADGLLFTLDAGADTVFKVDPVTGGVVGSCTTGLIAVGGLAAEDDRLFAIVGLTGIIEIDPDSCAVLGGPFAAPGGDFLMGLAFDGEHLYAGTLISRRIYTLDPSTGAVVHSVETGFVPTGLGSSAEVPSETVTVELDVKPGTCRNPLNVRSRGSLPVAIVGSGSFDVGQIDLDTVRLEGVAPTKAKFGDIVAADDCSSAGSDDMLDVLLKFDTAEVVEAMAENGPLYNRMEIVVRVEGMLHDGTLFSGEDTVTILGARSPGLQGAEDRGQKLGPKEPRP